MAKNSHSTKRNESSNKKPETKRKDTRERKIDRTRSHSSGMKKHLSKNNAMLGFYIGIGAIVFIFIYSLFTSQSETFGSKLNDAFLETVRVLNVTKEDYSEKGIVSNSLKLEQIQEGYPLVNAKHNEIETYSGFHLSYNEQYEQANWVSYILTKQMVRNDKVDRNDNFRSDENIQTGSATLEDYKGSGYDRGHLAPAADMHWSELSMDESFLMSNMSPQEEAFNRGVWKSLEEKVRDFAVENQRIFVITGPLFNEIKKKIGPNKVAVPKYYYKVILDISPPNYKGIAFLLENRESENKLQTFAMSIDELEKYSGIDFFYLVKDPAIDKIEATYNEFEWNF